MAITHDLTYHAAPGTTDGAVLGRDATAKDSFFGGTPVAQQVVPLTSPTLAQVISALVAMNLIAQHD